MHNFLPAGVDRTASPLVAGRALRSFCDGYIAVVLPAYLLELGFGQFEVGLLSTVTLAGSAIATLFVGLAGHRLPRHNLLPWAALLMLATGVGMAATSLFWLLLLVAFAGTINPSSGDVSVFLPLEQTRLAEAAGAGSRTALFARYSLAGSLAAAAGALAAGFPDWLVSVVEVERLVALRLMFVGYAAAGGILWIMYRQVPQPHGSRPAPQPLRESRGTVWKIALLFSLDSFAGGLLVNSLLSLWLMERFGLSLSLTGAFLAATGTLSAISQLAAAPVARRIGLVNTMVFTHIPANLCLIAAAAASGPVTALGFLAARSLLSQMDVPARTSFVTSAVTPAERPAALSFTAVPRSLAAAASPALSGALLAAGMLSAPLVLCGVLKITYDLGVFAAFRRLRLPRE